MVMTSSVSHEAIFDWYHAWNRRDWDHIKSLLAEEFTCEDMALKRTLRGRDAYLDYAKAWAHAFSDGVLKIDRISGSGKSGQSVVVEYQSKGTQTGNFGPFKPTYRQAEFAFVDILRFHNEKLVSCRTYADYYRPMVQLGHVVSVRMVHKPKKHAA